MSTRLESFSTPTGSDLDTPPPLLQTALRERSPLELLEASEAPVPPLIVAMAVATAVSPPPPLPPPLPPLVDASLMEQPPPLPPPLLPRRSTLTAAVDFEATSVGALLADSPPADSLPPLSAGALNSELESNRMFRKLSAQITRFLDECNKRSCRRRHRSERPYENSAPRRSSLRAQHFDSADCVARLQEFMMAMLEQCEYKSPAVSRRSVADESGQRAFRSEPPSTTRGLRFLPFSYVK